MKLNMKRVGDIVTLQAEGTAEELAVFAELAGLSNDDRHIIIALDEDEDDESVSHEAH